MLCTGCFATSMLATGIEPVRILLRRILSPVRLPVPPRQHTIKAYKVLIAKWARVDSNHRSKLQQIYSLSPLATRELTHTFLSVFYRPKHNNTTKKITQVNSFLFFNLFNNSFIFHIKIEIIHKKISQIITHTLRQ